MNEPTHNWKAVRTTVPVRIPALDGQTIHETILVEADAWRNPADGETYLSGEVLEKLDAIKARHMGLRQPDNTASN